MHAYFSYNTFAQIIFFCHSGQHTNERIKEFMHQVGHDFLSDDCLIAAVVTDGGKNFALAGAGLAGVYCTPIIFV